MKLLLKLLLLIFSFSSCDILRFSQFEIVSWSPGEGYHRNPENITISLTFSHIPDISSVEKRFTLTGDNGRVNGVFIWKGRKMIFSPLVPLEKNTDYSISLSAEASNTKGLSLDKAFERKFSTKPGTERPVLVSHYPLMYEEIDNLRSEVRLEFSLPVPLSTLYDNVSFSPSITGIWRLEDYNKLAVFTPAEPWQQNRRYEFHVSSSLTDYNGMNIRNDFTGVFITGSDREEPVLLSANRITKNGSFIQLDPDTSGFTGAVNTLIENSGWEKEDRLFLSFSKPVDGISVKNYLSVENASSFVLETSPGYETEFTFRFEAIPVYESRFTVRLKAGIKDIAGNESKNEYVFRIFANGKHSKPPELAGIRVPVSPGSKTDPGLVAFGINSLFKDFPITDDPDSYPSGETVKTCIELYFITAQDASIDIFSVMELFRVETTNSVLSFSPRQIKTGNFTFPEPEEDWKDYQRLEIGGNLTNSIYYGIVNFQIAPGLKDSMNNRNENQQRISVIK